MEESLIGITGKNYSSIAQLVERRTVNPSVPGSSPGRGAKQLRVREMVSHRSHKPKVGGSIPSLRNQTWGISSAGRAPALQAGGQRFDPVILHHIMRVQC